MQSQKNKVPPKALSAYNNIMNKVKLELIMI